MKEKKFNKRKRKLLKKVFNYSMSCIEIALNSSQENQIRWLKEQKKYRRYDVSHFIHFPNLLDFYEKCYPLDYDGYDESFILCMMIELSLCIDKKEMSKLYWSLRALILTSKIEIDIDQVINHLLNEFAKEYPEYFLNSK